MAHRITRSWLAIAAVVIAAGAFGCGDSDDPNPAGPSPGASVGSGGSGGSGGGGTSGGGSGRLTLRITDTPFADAKAVLVTFDNISVHRSGAGWEDIAFAGGATERTCDLKKLEGPTDLLGTETLPAGHYTQIRLHVKQATIHFDNESTSSTACEPSITVPGTQFASVRVASGEVKLNRQFTLEADGAVQILLDFDGDKSIREQGGGKSKKGGNTTPENGRYSMQPVVKVVSVTAQ